jgi:hypothetical protein
MKRAALAGLFVLFSGSTAFAQVPAGWNVKVDGNGNTSHVKVLDLGPGTLHVTTGPAIVIWPNETADMKGNYAFTATFTQTKAPMHPEAYGLFIGGQNMTTPDAEYGYVIVRGDGKYSIKHRANAKDVHEIKPWTDLEGMNKADANGKATNTVKFEAKSDSVRAFVNDKQVAAWGRQYWGAQGVAGIRVNHQLDMHITDVKVTPIK